MLRDTHLWTLLVLLPVIPLDAQERAGSITGRLTDQSGGILPGVSVAVLNGPKSRATIGTTDTAGIYFIVLEPGRTPFVSRCEALRARKSRTSKCSWPHISLSTARCRSATFRKPFRSPRNRRLKSIRAARSSPTTSRPRKWIVFRGAQFPGHRHGRAVGEPGRIQAAFR